VFSISLSLSSIPVLTPQFQYLSCLTWLCQYKIFHLIPLDASISYDALSTASKVSVQRLKAVIRMSMTTGLFREDVAGSVVHSATSALLARDPVVYSYATHMTGGSAPVAQKMAAAALKWGPDSTQPYETAFNVALDTDLPFFDHLSRNPDKMAEFSAYMRNVRSSDTVALRHLTAGFAWEGIREDGVVVDVGGSTGDAAIALVEAFPHLKLVVQDLPANVDNGRKMLDSSPKKASLAARITFQGHDFMEKQPVQDADVYLLRMILHDWTDAQAVKIVRNLVDAMKDRPSSKLLIMDTVLPKPGSVPVSIERLFRVRDMTMLQSFNSKERDLYDWKALLADVDAGLHLVNVVQPFGSALSVLEVTLDK
jgi:6-hydroxytryprostatin B O-methyltransferase